MYYTKTNSHLGVDDLLNNIAIATSPLIVYADYGISISHLNTCAYSSIKLL